MESATVLFPDAAGGSGEGSDGGEVTRDTRVEALLDDWKLTYELDPDFPLAKLKIDSAVQIRKEAHRAPTDTVDQYLTHMKHGAMFPPLVIAHNGQLVDGNTRVEALRKLGRKTFPAYRVKFPHMGMAKMIGAAVNQMGGDRLAEDEIVEAAGVMMQEGYGDESIARTLGRSVSHVRNVRRDRTYRDAAQRTGVDQLTLPKPVQRALAPITHDAPFRAAVEAVHRAKPSPKDVAALVRKIEDTRSDSEAIAVVQAIEQQWGPVTGPPPHENRKSLSKSRAKKVLKLVRVLITEINDQTADLAIPNDVEATASWQKLVALGTQVVALSIPVQ